MGSAAEGRSEHVTLWVEVKHGTRPHTDQLRAYLVGQRERGLVNAAVLLVAPRSQIPTFARIQIPDEVPRLTWEETAELVKSYAAEDAIGSFLLAELCTYLREEKLMDPDQLTPAHIVALTNHREAIIALERLCHLADEEVSRRWNAQDSHDWYPRSHPSQSWWNYATHSRTSEAPARAGAWYFEWLLFRDAAEHFSDGRPGVPCFATGMTAEASSRSLSKLDQQTRARFEREGFEVIPANRPTDYEHVWRRAYPEEVLAGRDLIRQGAALGSWMVDSFTALSKALDESP